VSKIFAQSFPIFTHIKGLKVLLKSSLKAKGIVLRGMIESFCSKVLVGITKYLLKIWSARKMKCIQGNGLNDCRL
jgi:hypothetical protein